MGLGTAQGGRLHTTVPRGFLEEEREKIRKERSIKILWLNIVVKFKFYYKILGGDLGLFTLVVSKEKYYKRGGIT